VQNVVHTAAGLVKSVKIEQISFMEVDLAQYLGYIFALAGGKIVESPDFLALRQELLAKLDPVKPATPVTR